METLLTLSKETRCRNHLKGIAETFLTYTVLSISFEVEVPTGKVILQLKYMPIVMNLARIASSDWKS